MKKRKHWLGVINCLAVDSNGNNNSLAQLWSDEVTITILSFPKNHIHAIINSRIPQHANRFFTGIYGHQKIHNKHKTWELLTSLYSGGSDNMWLVCGDFNEIVKPSEKWGGK